MAAVDKAPVILDATWVVPGADPDFRYRILDGARHFDLAYLKSNTPLGSRFPPAQIIARMLSEAGVNDGDAVQVYDRVGLFSSPFVRWAIRSIGFEDVTLLNPVPTHHETVDDHAGVEHVGHVLTDTPLVKAVIKDEILAALDTDIQIVDARGRGRFSGQEPEPRAGLRSGHIPGSINLPYGEMIDSERQFKADNAARIEAAGIDLGKPIITTCGSGVTAAGLAYIFEQLGAKDVSVYLGSWTEWGASDLPIETGA